MKTYSVTLLNNEEKTIKGINLMFALWAFGYSLTDLKNWKLL